MPFESNIDPLIDPWTGKPYDDDANPYVTADPSDPGYEMSPVLPDSTLREQVAQALHNVEFDIEPVNLSIHATRFYAMADALLPLFAVVSAEAEKRGAAKGWADCVEQYRLSINEGYIPEPEKGQNT